MYSDVQCMVLIWLSRQEGHAQPPLDPSGSGLPEGFHCFPAHIWGTYGDHLPIPSNSINFAQYPSYPSFSLGDTVVCGFFCRFQLWCSVSRVETVVQQPAQQKEASRSSSRPFAVPKRCQDASWGRKQCISQLAPLHVLLSRPKVLGRNLRAWKWADTPWQLSRRPVAKTVPEGFWVDEVWMNLIELCTA